MCGLGWVIFFQTGAFVHISEPNFHTNLEYVLICVFWGLLRSEKKENEDEKLCKFGMLRIRGLKPAGGRWLGNLPKIVEIFIFRTVCFIFDQTKESTHRELTDIYILQRLCWDVYICYVTHKRLRSMAGFAAERFSSESVMWRANVISSRQWWIWLFIRESWPCINQPCQFHVVKRIHPVINYRMNLRSWLYNDRSYSS